MMHKIDPSRMTHLGQIRSRMLGAVSGLTRDYNDQVQDRNEAKREVARLEEAKRFSREPESIEPRLGQAKLVLAKAEAALIATQAAIDQANERAGAAGGLHSRCTEFLEKGRVRA